MWIDDPRAYDCPPAELFNTAILGVGRGCFIGRSAHGPAIQATMRFHPPRWFSVAPGKYDHRWVKVNFPHIPYDQIATDAVWLFDRMLEKRGSDFVQKLVPVITLPTGMHDNAIRAAVEAGIKSVVCEKPLLPLGKLDVAVRLRRFLAAHPKVRAYFTWQHFKNWAMYSIRAVVQRDPSVVESIDGYFPQEWLQDDPHCMQETHRACDITCSPDDIGTHVQHGCGWLGGSTLAEVSDVKLEMYGKHAQRRKFYDRAAWRYRLANGIQGSCSVSQSSPGHQDDIHFHARIKGGEQHLWRMRWGTETHWHAPADKKVSLESTDGWEPHWRGNTTRFGDPALAGIFGLFSPPEHIQGWHVYMWALYLAIVGDILQRMEHPIVEYLPPIFRTGDTASIDNAVEMVAFVAALLKGFDSGQAVNVPALIAETEQAVEAEAT